MGVKRTRYARKMTPRYRCLLNDVQWMVDNGAGFSEAAHRLSMSAASLERVLYDFRRHDLIERLRAQDWADYPRRVNQHTAA